MATRFSGGGIGSFGAAAFGVLLVGACSSGDDLRQTTQSVTFNGQSRVEYLAATAEHQIWTNSVGVLLDEVSLASPGCDLFCPIQTQASGFCPSSPLSTQEAVESPGVSSCTAFMIGADLFATAGHCMQPDDAAG